MLLGLEEERKKYYTEHYVAVRCGRAAFWQFTASVLNSCSSKMAGGSSATWPEAYLSVRSFFVANSLRFPRRRISGAG